MPLRYTKIVCTIGPATSEENMIVELVKAGMDAARLNFSHGSHSEHLQRLKSLRKISEELKINISVIQDLPGPKLRVGKLLREPLKLEEGSIVKLSNSPFQQNDQEIPVLFKNLSKLVEVGSEVYLADGTIRLRVIDISKEWVSCRVELGGLLTTGKGINIPKAKGDVSAITEEDIEHIKFGVQNEVDYIAISFVRSARDILRAKEVLKGFNSDIPVIAKIEKSEAVENIQEIVSSCDAVMVARGDLGVEIGIENVPLVQKKVIKLANLLGKPVITATQILISMLSQPTPTRAEVSDIANAILDGTDALMLSEETAVGKYPLEAVRVLARVAASTEREMVYQPKPVIDAESVEEAIGRAACQVANAVKAKFIVAYTRSGSTARLIAKHRPMIPIKAFTPNTKVARRLSIVWGTESFYAQESANAPLPDMVEEHLKKLDLVRQGDTVIVVAGMPTGPVGSTNMIRVQKIEK